MYDEQNAYSYKCSRYRYTVEKKNFWWWFVRQVCAHYPNDINSVSTYY